MAGDETGPRKRALVAVLAVVSVIVAVAGVVLQNWPTALGSSLTAAAMIGSFWTTRPGGPRRTASRTG